MLTSIAMILLVGLAAGWAFSKLGLPSLMGMIFTGIIMSPYALNLIDDSILMISDDLRRIALVIILTRAGLTLDIGDLKKVGRPAVLMCFVPACAEMLGIILFAPMLLGVSLLDAAIIGSVVAAVSPAVIVPRMIRLIDEGYGTQKGIPQLILAGASVDDVFVIVIFTALTTLASTGTASWTSALKIPISIGMGILVGIAVGKALVIFCKRNHMRDSVKILILLSVSFLLLELENRVDEIVPMSGLLAIMTVGIVVKKQYGVLADRLSARYNKLWVAAELFLFVLVGATVDLKYAVAAGVSAALLIVAGLAFRMVGVSAALLKTNLTRKERMFCMTAYTPKATVQAAIGAIPLTMGLPCGQIVLTVAVLSILITAPFGAVCIDRCYCKWLTR